MVALASGELPSPPTTWGFARNPALRPQAADVEGRAARGVIARGRAIERAYHMTDALARARELVDAAHRADPARAEDGRPAELVYADRMEAWVQRLVPDPSPLLRLASRCQHLERWSVPRSEYPMDRTGYNAWRRTLYRRQAERARELLLDAGVAGKDAGDVATWVSKTGLLRNPGTQALEDAACLVFFENELAAFAAKHDDYPREKFLTILRRIWRKMSPPARELALGLEMPAVFTTLLRQATDSGEMQEDDPHAL